MFFLRLWNLFEGSRRKKMSDMLQGETQCIKTNKVKCFLYKKKVKCYTRFYLHAERVYGKLYVEIVWLGWGV